MFFYAIKKVCERISGKKQKSIEINALNNLSSRLSTYFDKNPYEC